MEDNFAVEMALEEVRFHLKQQLSGVDTMRDGMRIILGAASLVVTVLGGLRTWRGAPAANVDLFNGILVLSLAAFVATIALCLSVLLPMTYTLPFKADWDEYVKILMEKPERDALLVGVSQYLMAIEKNTPVFDKVTIRARWAGICFILVTLGMVGLGLVK